MTNPYPENPDIGLLYSSIVACVGVDKLKEIIECYYETQQELRNLKETYEQD